MPTTPRVCALARPTGTGRSQWVERVHRQRPDGDRRQRHLARNRQSHRVRGLPSISRAIRPSTMPPSISAARRGITITSRMTTPTTPVGVDAGAEPRRQCQHLQLRLPQLCRLQLCRRRDRQRGHDQCRGRYALRAGVQFHQSGQHHRRSGGGFYIYDTFTNAADGSCRERSRRKAYLDLRQQFAVECRNDHGRLRRNLHLYGNYTTAQLGSITDTGGTVYIDGTLTNTGATFNVGRGRAAVSGAGERRHDRRRHDVDQGSACSSRAAR